MALLADNHDTLHRGLVYQPAVQKGSIARPRRMIGSEKRHSKSQQLTVAHNTATKLAVIALISHTYPGALRMQCSSIHSMVTARSQHAVTYCEVFSEPIIVRIIGV